MDLIEQGDGGASGAQAGELLLQGAHGLVHPPAVL